MSNEPTRVTIELTPGQLQALKELAEKEQCEISELVSRGVDTFIATYLPGRTHASTDEKLDEMYDHILKLLVSTMKLVGQNLYFSSLPLTAGPVKAKLNDEGVAIQWHQSERFAIDLLSGDNPRAAKPADKGNA